ncbi:MAG: hypothetical protein MZV70_20575 [Desulfobacterales bacterium]|nr:hypothetical protein [Desulfobacterales bacterium]
MMVEGHKMNLVYYDLRTATTALERYVADYAALPRRRTASRGHLPARRAL